MQRMEILNYTDIINKYYPEDNELRRILWVHSRHVADKALALARRHQELNIDMQFVEEAAMLHDIGILRCDAAGIQCFGTEPYICHGTIGAEMMRAEGLPRHALVCERHTGTGLTLQYIIDNNLPLPHRDLVPVSIEEQLICFADKFFSKTRPDEEKTVEQALRSIAKFGDECAEKFNRWSQLFL